MNQSIQFQSPPVLVIKHRFMIKYQKMRCRFFDGYALTEYGNHQVAKKSYEAMKNSGQKCELAGNVLKEYRKGMKAWAIFDLYLEDVKKAMTKNGKMMNISYDLEDENERTD